MLDLFCGRWGWSRAFAARGWECVGIDLTAPPEIPEGCTFIQADIMNLRYSPDFQGGAWFLVDPANMTRQFLGHFDFICASSPCEQFSVHGMKHFHPNPKYPEIGLALFNHTKMLCESAGVPFVMENVRAAQQFVGDAVHHCGPFYLWGTGVPMLMAQGIKKGFSCTWNPETRERSASQLARVRNKTVYSGMQMGNSKHVNAMTPEEKRVYRKQFSMISAGSKSTERQMHTAAAATIPPELASCVVDYAEYICGVRA